MTGFNDRPAHLLCSKTYYEPDLAVVPFRVSRFLLALILVPVDSPAAMGAASLGQGRGTIPIATVSLRICVSAT